MKVPFVHTVIHEISTMHGKWSASMLQKIIIQKIIIQKIIISKDYATWKTIYCHS